MFNRFHRASDIRLERMFETRSDAWHRVGLAMDVTQRTARKAKRQAAVVLAAFLWNAANGDALPRPPLPTQPTKTDPFAYADE